ncbi:MAG TPA: hypothetical protein VGA20_01190 [Gemmatimonadales bacterium]
MTRFFLAKAWLAGAGLALGLMGIVVETRWLVWLAIILLVAAVLLRFGERRDGVVPPERKR